MAERQQKGVPSVYSFSFSFAFSSQPLFPLYIFSYFIFKFSKSRWPPPVTLTYGGCTTKPIKDTTFKSVYSIYKKKTKTKINIATRYFWWGIYINQSFE